MKCLIIGGVAGGATTAARLRRLDEDATIVIFEKGPYISYANCGLPYYLGGTIPERNQLFLQTPTSFGNRFDADVRVKTEVVAIDRAAKMVKCVNLATGKEYEEGYDKLVLAPGTTAVRPPIAGIDGPNIFTLRDVPDTDAIQARLQQLSAGGRAVVVGAGFIGVEMADEVGALNRLLKTLFESNINVDYIYLSFNRDSSLPVQILHAQDTPEVEECIRAKGFRVL